MNAQKLASSLLYLPVTLEGRVQLWLTYKDLKTVTTVQFKNPPYDLDRNKRVFRWFKNAGLSFSPDSKSSEFIYVSKDKACAVEASEIMWSEKKEDVLRKGELFGYPSEAVKAFSDKKKMLLLTPTNFKEYWGLYTRYMVREDHVSDDTIISKSWAQTIRKDLPKLASWYEKEISNATFR